MKLPKFRRRISSQRNEGEKLDRRRQRESKLRPLHAELEDALDWEDGAGRIAIEEIGELYGVDHRRRKTTRPQIRFVNRARRSRAGSASLAESAMLAGTFEKRADRMLAWEPLGLDEQGWTEFHAAMTSCFGAVAQIKVDSRNRLDESGEKVIPTTFCTLGFESPLGARAQSHGEDTDDEVGIEGRAGDERAVIRI